MGGKSDIFVIMGNPATLALMKVRDLLNEKHL